MLAVTNNRLVFQVYGLRYGFFLLLLRNKKL